MTADLQAHMGCKFDCMTRELPQLELQSSMLSVQNLDLI
jgi:hypothetical protein